MLRRYINHIKLTRTPHERRSHALQIATGTTALVALVWITTLGMRFANPGQGDQTQTAGAANASNSTLNTLVVASSTSNY